MADTPDQVETLLLSFLGDNPKSPKQVRTAMNKRLEKSPDSAAAWTARAWAHYELEQFEDAISDATRAIELCGEAYLAWHVRGVAHFCLCHLEETDRDLSEAIRLSSGVELFLEEAYLSRGGARCDTGRLEDALKDLRQCLKLAPDHAWAYLYRGNVRCRQRQFKKAIQDFEKAIALDRDDGRPRAHLAWLLATCDDPKVRDGKRALQLAKQANKLSGDEYPGELAAAHAELGKFKDAVKVLQPSLRNCDDATELALRKRCLAKYEAGEPYHARWDE
ncbi:MAG: tetratricopeptide repeat protein [Planctomycetales bacterium]|nr:tetratricopeptide repeat protein [Planctomycetales bacterium]